MSYSKKSVCYLPRYLIHSVLNQWLHGLQEKSINLTFKFTFSLLEFMHNTLQKLITLTWNKLTFYSVAMIIIHFGIGVSLPCLDWCFHIVFQLVHIGEGVHGGGLNDIFLNRWLNIILFMHTFLCSGLTGYLDWDS